MLYAPLIPSLPVIDGLSCSVRIRAFYIGPRAKDTLFVQFVFGIRGRSMDHSTSSRLSPQRGIDLFNLLSRSERFVLSLVRPLRWVIHRSIRRVDVLGPGPRRPEGWARESYCRKASSVTLWVSFLFNLCALMMAVLWRDGAIGTGARDPGTIAFTARYSVHDDGVSASANGVFRRRDRQCS